MVITLRLQISFIPLPGKNSNHFVHIQSFTFLKAKFLLMSKVLTSLGCISRVPSVWSSSQARIILKFYDYVLRSASSPNTLIKCWIRKNLARVPTVTSLMAAHQFNKILKRIYSIHFHEHIWEPPSFFPKFYYLFLFCLAMPWGMWNLSSPTKDRTCVLHIGSTES